MTVRVGGDAGAPAVAALRTAWTEETSGRATGDVAFYERAGFGPATMLMAVVL